MKFVDKLITISKKRTSLTRILCGSIGVFLLAAIIAVNCILNYYSLILNRFFAGDNVSASDEQAKGVLELGDDAVRYAADESMVLLKNDNNFLPIEDLTKVNLFGYGSTDNGFLLSGGGSGGTIITDEKDIKVDLTDAFKNEGVEYNPTLYAAYASFSNVDSDFGSTGAYVVDSLINPPASFYTAERMQNAKGYSPVAVATISRWGAENGGAEELKNIGPFRDGTYLELTNEERAMFDALETHGFQVIVVLNTCNNVELGFLETYSCIKACIFAGIPGQSGANAVPRIIKGTVNPSGRTSDTLAYDYQTNNPVYANAIKTGYNGGSSIVYQEDIYFGYKWYETADAEGLFESAGGYDKVVQFPFGYGLSYTDFSWEVTSFPSVTSLTVDGNYEVKVNVTNTGERAGKDVVQLYGHADYINGGIEKPERTLLDFVKTPLLQPQESQEVTLKFTAYDLASYDAYDKNHNRFAGYEIDGGDNSIEISVQRNAHAKEAALSKKYSAPAIKFATDPVTGEKVGNLFTGSKAYAACPIDGSTVYTGGITYLSRQGHFSNLAQIQPIGAPSNNSAVETASAYAYRGYDKLDTSYIEYGVDYGLYLVQVVKKDGDDKETYSRATFKQLSGDDTSVTLAFNTRLLEILNDYDSPAWEIFLNQLTKNEIKELIGNGGFTTSAVQSVGKTRCTDKDGPAGFNNNVTNPGKPSIYTLYPSESLLGCSWNSDVGFKIGEAQGRIGSELGINGWYGPGVNLHRSVYNSRNYEYFSEDAMVSGKLAAAVIKGAKENHVYCYLKHMAVSEAGENPKNLNTWLTEQSLREHYLKAFEIAVKAGDANAIMSAFNRVGAVLSGYNHAMLTDVLRTEWGFRGSVITDWYDGGGYMSSHKQGILGGNNLWLCGTTSQPANINFGNSAQAYAARLAAKDILYTYVNTYYTASDIKVNTEVTSPLFRFMWASIDIVFILGLLVCVGFFTLTFLLREGESKPPKRYKVLCLKCGEPIYSTDKFCPHCGAPYHPLGVEEPPSPPPEE